MKRHLLPASTVSSPPGFGCQLKFWLTLAVVAWGSACAPLPCDLDGDGLCPPLDCNDANPEAQDCTSTPPPTGVPTETPTALPTDAPTDGPTSPTAPPSVTDTPTPPGFTATPSPTGTPTPAPTPCADDDQDGHCAQADCDDADPAIHPTAAEQCNGRDDDCDGTADDPELRHWYVDLDGDGYGLETEFVYGFCAVEPGYSLARGDCDDGNVQRYPGAADPTGDGIDQDCGGTDAAEPSVGLDASQFVDLQPALDAASPGTTVWVGPGRYPTLELRFGGKALALRSTHLEDETILDGERVGPILILDQGEGPGTSVDGFTLTRGYSNAFQDLLRVAAALTLYYAELTLTRVHIVDNQAEEMDIVSTVGSKLSMNQVSIDHNMTQGEGYTLLLGNTETLLHQSAVFSNDSGRTNLSIGGYGDDENTLRMTQSTIAYNHSSRAPAGIDFMYVGRVEIINSIFSQNVPVNYFFYGRTYAGDPAVPPAVQSSVNFDLAGGGDEFDQLTPPFLKHNPQFLLAPGKRPTHVSDLRLRPGSPLRDAGEGTELDPDGSPPDIGYFGGTDADWRVYWDADNDQLFDDWEAQHGLSFVHDDAAGDADSDGLDNLTELTLALPPDTADTDADGFNDGDEVAQSRDPFSPFSQPGIEGLIPLRVPEDYPTLQAAVDAIPVEGVISTASQQLDQSLDVRNKSIRLEARDTLSTELVLSPVASLDLFQSDVIIEGISVRSLTPTADTPYDLSAVRMHGSDIQLDQVKIEEHLSRSALLDVEFSKLHADALVLQYNGSTSPYSTLMYGYHSDTSLEDSIIRYNKRGGLRFGDSRLVARNIELQHNTGADKLCTVFDSSTAHFENVSMLYNAGYSAGVLGVNSGSKATIRNSILLKNSGAAGNFTGAGASGNIGGIQSSDSELTLVNTIVAYNIGTNLAIGTDDTGAPTTQLDLRYSVVYAPRGPYHNLTELPPTLYEIDPLLLTRGPMLNFADDLHLRPDSPLINGGDPGITDPDGSRSDIGLYGGPNADMSGYLDSDQDGLYDVWEITYGLDPSRAEAQEDPDNDGLTNWEEITAGLHPMRADTDRDGAIDGDELDAESDPLNPSRVPGMSELRVIKVPEDYSSIQEAVNHIPDEGAIEVAPGLYEDNVGIFFQSIALEGQTDATRTVLEGNGERVITVSQGDLILRRFTIQGGYAYRGGGIHLLNSTGILTDLIVQENTAGMGGGGLNTHASPITLERALFRHNFSGEIDMGFGGGLELGGAESILRYVRIEENTTTKWGGGLELGSDRTLLDHCVILNNNSTFNQATGGGIVYSSPNVHIEHSIVAYNFGGNIIIFNHGEPTPLDLHYTNVYNPPGYQGNMVGFIPDPSTLTFEPGFLEYSRDGIPLSPHLSSTSRLINAGDPAVCSSQNSAGCDADGSRPDLGIYGGPEGDTWDLDDDGFPDWFWPGPYSAPPTGTSNADFDCDDLNAALNPGSSTCASLRTRITQEAEWP